MIATKHTWPRALQVAAAAAFALLYVTAGSAIYFLAECLGQLVASLLALLALLPVGLLNVFVACLADADCFDRQDVTPLTATLIGAFLVLILAALLGAVVGCVAFIQFLLSNGFSFAGAMSVATALCWLVALALYVAFRRGHLR